MSHLKAWCLAKMMNENFIELPLQRLGIFVPYPSFFGLVTAFNSPAMRRTRTAAFSATAKILVA